MSDSQPNSSEIAKAWEKLPEGQLPVIRDLIALLGRSDELAVLPDGSFFKDPQNINTLIEDLIMLHRKVGLDSPFLKYRKEEKRKQLFESDDRDWEKKLKLALNEASLMGALKAKAVPSTPPALPALPSLPKLEALAEKAPHLKMLNPVELQKNALLPEPSPSLFILWIVSGVALILSVIALLK